MKRMLLPIGLCAALMLSGCSPDDATPENRKVEFKDGAGDGSVI